MKLTLWQIKGGVGEILTLYKTCSICLVVCWRRQVAFTLTSVLENTYRAKVAYILRILSSDDNVRPQTLIFFYIRTLNAVLLLSGGQILLLDSSQLAGLLFRVLMPSSMLGLATAS